MTEQPVYTLEAVAPPSPPAPEPEEVVGYLVVDARPSTGGRVRWMTPRPSHTLSGARRDRDFWVEAAPDRVLRLAKVVLLSDPPAKEEAPVSEEEAGGAGERR